MRGLVALVLATFPLSALGGEAPSDWATYRSEIGGYELGYPPSMTLKPFLDGRSAELADAATGERLVDIDLWPTDLCPREKRKITAKDLGIERASEVTQADGDDGSSVCGKPVRAQASVSDHGVPWWELTLTCVGERFPENHAGHRARKPVRTSDGKKGPTFFADVSQPWRTRVLMIDPGGVDPRTARPGERTVAPEIVRAILATLRTIPLPDPHVVCIEDFGHDAIPTPAARP